MLQLQRCKNNHARAYGRTVRARASELKFDRARR
jgi:hypothetical protein